MQRYLRIEIDCNTVYCGTCEKLNKLHSKCKEFGSELKLLKEEFFNKKGHVLKFERCRECLDAEIQDEAVSK